MVRFTDERPDFIARRFRRHATARSFVERLRSEYYHPDGSIEITEIEEGAMEIQQQTNSFQSVCWALKLSEFERQLKELRCEIEKANSTLSEPAA